MKQFWWQRIDLGYKNNELYLGDCLLSQLAKRYDHPVFVYYLPRVISNVNRVKAALTGYFPHVQLYYAMKANRFMPLLTGLKLSGVCGLDVCSPKEVAWAISCGFSPDELSYTGTSLSKKDIALLSQYPDLHINCDSLAQIKQLGETGLFQNIGLRINPGMGISYHNQSVLNYASYNSKFGIYYPYLEQALDLAKQYNFTIDTIHFHTGCGYLSQDLQNFAAVLDQVIPFIEKIPNKVTINIGGGLGVPHQIMDTPLDLPQWAAILYDKLGPYTDSIALEPGDYIVKDAGVLLVETTFIETKGQTHFMGVNAGFNIAIEPSFYNLPCEAALCSLPETNAFKPYTIVGNINEALDVWLRDFSLPEEIQAGEILAFLNAGGYASAMASNHCLRGEFSEILII